MGQGLPTDLLDFTFDDPAERLRWNLTILSNSLDYAQAQTEGYKDPTSKKVEKIKRMADELGIRKKRSQM